MLHEDIRKLGQSSPVMDQERASPVLQKNWQDLIKPTKLNVAAGRDPSRYATVVAEPLERGFGLTLGNALRRVLLSSLQGAAITSVHIDGVLHEFSSIPGVREDVTDIVLNIKEIALRQHAEGVKRMVLKKEGPGVARAGDIETGAAGAAGDLVELPRGQLSGATAVVLAQRRQQHGADGHVDADAEGVGPADHLEKS